MTSQQFFFSAFALAGFSICGCQSWQGASFPMQNATRVPPPGTGTYQLPSGYYNNSSNTSALAPANSMMQATAGVNGTGTLPATNLAAATLASPLGAPANSSVSRSTYATTELTPSATTFAPVSTVTAGYSNSPTSLPNDSFASIPASAVVTASAAQSAAPSTTPQFSQANAATSAGNSASISDGGAPDESPLNVEAPSLQWQQFGEH